MTEAAQLTDEQIRAGWGGSVWGWGWCGVFP